MSDKHSPIIKVASERSFIGIFRTNFTLKDLASKSTNKKFYEDISKKQKNKTILPKSGPDVTLIHDESTSMIKNGFSASDSMLQLSGRVYLKYQKKLLLDDFSSSNNINLNFPNSVSSDSSICSSTRCSSNLGLQISSTTLTSELLPPEPPDGGWGWVVVMAAFFVQMITDGIQVSFGIFIDDFFDDFNESLSVTSWVGSFAYGIPALCAPLASILISRFGCRKVCVMGGVISAVGCSISFFVRSMIGLILTFGVLSGLGSSLSSTAALIIVAVYFDDHRATATGLSIAGTGVGAFVFAPLVYWLISMYTWRGTMLILSGIFANLIVCGVLMRPVETVRERHKRQLLACMENFAKESRFKLPVIYLKSENRNIDYRIHLLRKLFTSPINISGTDLSIISTSKIVALGYKRHNETTSIQENHLHEIVLSSSFISIPKICPKSSYSNSTMPDQIELHEKRSSKHKQLSLPDFNPILRNNQTRVFEFNKIIHKKNRANTMSSNLLTTSNPEVCTPQCFLDFVQESQLPRAHRRYSHEIVKNTKPLNVQNTASSKIDRQDFCFVPYRVPNLIALRSSLARFQPLYARNKRSVFHKSTVYQSSTEHHLRAVFSMPELISVSHTTSSASSISRSYWSCLSTRLKSVVDPSLFRSLDFNIFLISNLCLYFWCNVTYFFIAIYAMKHDISSTSAAMLFSIMGAADMVGEVAFGWAADQKWFNTLILYTSAVLVCGVSTIFVPFATSLTPLVIYSIIFGFTMAANDSLCTVLVIEFVGLSRLVNGLGFCLFCQGMATIFGPPVIGFIMDASGSHAVAFVVCGVGVACAALVMFPVIVRERRHKAAKRRRREVRLLLSTSSSGNAAPIAIDA